MRRFLIARALIALALLLAMPAAAAAYTNGHLPARALAHEGPATCNELARVPAAAWNTMRIYAHQHSLPLDAPGCDGDYRPYVRQVYWRQWWCAHGNCANAAIPGRSDHGLGRAVDVDVRTRHTIDRIGRRFGWAKSCSDAPRESWHVLHCAPWRHRPNPGLSDIEPLMAEGSGGPGQAVYVREIQTLLRRHGATVGVDGNYGPTTRRAVIRFQTAVGLPGDGRVGHKTWLKLRHVQGPVQVQIPRPAPPVRGPVTGPDFSSNQPAIDLAKVRAAGHEFVGLKTSEGGDWRDPTYPVRARAAHAHQLLVMPYHFLRPRPGRRGSVEATLAIAAAEAGGWRKGDLPLVADIETTTLTPAGTCRYLHEFLERADKATGTRALVYSYPAFIRAELGGCGPWLRRHRLWLAAYQDAAPAAPAPWRRWSIWQRTDHAHLPGVAGGVDLSTIPGGKPALHKLTVR